MMADAQQARDKPCIVEKSEITFFNDDGSIRWQRGLPQVSEWPRRGTLIEVSDRLAYGEYRYLQALTVDSVIVCFCPRGGLDWNVWFDTKTGHIADVTEAR
jgi:hypothetical protein